MLGLLVARTGVWKLGCALNLVGGGGRLYTGDGRLDGGGGPRGGPGCLFSVDELQINGRERVVMQIWANGVKFLPLGVPTPD